jgi:hypothetical protein
MSGQRLCNHRTATQQIEESEMNTGQHWSPVHVEQEVLNAAKYTIERAKAGNDSAGMSVINQCIVALRDVVKSGTLPDMERVLYLRSLLESLELITDDSVKPARALCLEKSRGRPQDQYKLAKDLKIFITVSRKYDELIERGHTRGDSPVTEAIKQASKELGASTTSVQKVWSEHGSAAGRPSIKPDLK